MTPGGLLLVVLLGLAALVLATVLLVKARPRVACARCGQRIDPSDPRTYQACPACGLPWHQQM